MWYQAHNGVLINLDSIGYITPWYGQYDKARIVWINGHDFLVNTEQEYLNIKDIIERTRGIT